MARLCAIAQSYYVTSRWPSCILTPLRTVDRDLGWLLREQLEPGGRHRIPRITWLSVSIPGPTEAIEWMIGLFHHVPERKSIYTGHAVHQYDDLCGDVPAFLEHRLYDSRISPSFCMFHMAAQNHPDSCGLCTGFTHSMVLC